MTILEELDLVVSVTKDERDCATVHFALRNEPVTVLGVAFDARATTLGRTSWIEATAGHLPASVLQLVDDEYQEALKNEVLGVLLSDFHRDKPSPSAGSAPAM